MKKSSTLFLKLAIFIIASPIVALCVIALPLLIKDVIEESSKWMYVIYSFVTIMYLSAIPFFIALFQAFKLLTYIDKNTAFSDLSVLALRKIKKCAIMISCLQVVNLPFFYFFAQSDDAPGVVIIGLICVFAPMVIAVFAAVLQKLLTDAIELKSENDLTV